MGAACPHSRQVEQTAPTACTQYHTGFSLSRKKEGRSLGLDAKLSSDPSVPGAQRKHSGQCWDSGCRAEREHRQRTRRRGNPTKAPNSLPAQEVAGSFPLSQDRAACRDLRGGPAQHTHTDSKVPKSLTQAVQPLEWNPHTSLIPKGRPSPEFPLLAWYLTLMAAQNGRP
jgi:hypothetical protein